MTTVQWNGQSGTQYKFEVYPIGQEFKPLSGVYVFCRPGKPGFLEALYVGETQSFYDRLNTGLRNHDGFKSAQRAGATHVAVMQVANAPQRLRIETDLRHGLNPVCNRQGIGITPTR